MRQSASTASWVIVLSLAGTAKATNVGSLRKTANATVPMDALTATVYGKSRCPCVGIHNLQGYYATNMDYYHIQYPLDAGSSCFPWELTTHADCKDGGGPEWCAQRWCYVDPCNCELAELPVMSKTGVLYQGSPAYYSYDTCGFLDMYTEIMSKEACVNQKNEKDCGKHSKCAWDGKRCGGKKAMETCEKGLSIDESVHGQEDCRCVGLSGKEPGKAFMYINDEDLLAYPSDVGATCKPWEAEVHPECLADGETPSWCSQSWCFVDPCKCKTAVPPKMVMKANRALQFQGKTAFWSYATCGGVDTWSADNAEEYCITQKTKTECITLGAPVLRCAWDGKQCLGKALVGICQKQQETGILTPDDILDQYKSSASIKSTLMAVAVAVGAFVAL